MTHFSALSDILGWSLLLLSIAFAALSRGAIKRRGLDWRWWLLTGVVLVIFRWPIARLQHALYPDENQMIAGAITLAHDPVFWRSVDGGTAGPLDFFPLLPTALINGPGSYTIARLIALTTVWVSLIAIAETLAVFTSRRVARVAVLPFFIFEALTTSAEFTHYSTELVPGLMLAAAIFLIVRHRFSPSQGNLLMASLILGAMPFSKLQAAPIAASIAVLFALQELIAGRGKNLGLIAPALLIPALIIVSVQITFDQVDHLVIPYFLQNVAYVDDSNLPLSAVAGHLWSQSLTSGYLAAWLSGSAGFLVLAGFLSQPASRSSRSIGIGLCTVLIVAMVCVLVPRRPYHHYLNLLFGPLSLVLGWTLASITADQTAATRARRSLSVLFFVLCCVVPQISFRLFRETDPFASYNNAEPGPEHRQLNALISSFTRRGEALGIWGWRSSLYVETGLRQATREAHSEGQMEAGRWQSYFLQIYLNDIKKSKPPIFVDAVGEGNFKYRDRKLGYESFPPLREWVAAHYTLVADLDGARVFARNDRIPQSTVTGALPPL